MKADKPLIAAKPLLLVCAVAVGLVGWTLKPASTAHAAEPVRRPVPVASLQDLMKSEIAPSADVVWKAVGAVDDKDIKPETDEDWAKVHDAALLLVEAPNLLTAPGRQIVHPGAKLQDEGQDGNLTSAEMQKRIAANPAVFAGYARGLQLAALETLAAIDKKDVDGVMEAGGKIDEACEACHVRYWYPGAAK